jgi:predicted RNase H-like HicB family nuclease
MATTATGMLLASKNGDISAAELISETDNIWVLEVEKREVRVSKGDTRQRAFREMTDALEWAEADPELIEHFVGLMASKAAPGNQEQN